VVDRLCETIYGLNLILRLFSQVEFWSKHETEGNMSSNKVYFLKFYQKNLLSFRSCTLNIKVSSKISQETPLSLVEKWTLSWFWSTSFLRIVFLNSFCHNSLSLLNRFLKMSLKVKQETRTWMFWTHLFLLRWSVSTKIYKFRIRFDWTTVDSFYWPIKDHYENFFGKLSNFENNLNHWLFKSW
jgi:hypothetical protein